uniref:polymeric immunoglobulin receptor-like n=1 Tax=Pristiophorus japonicus TaxID=55135 RepID=UPI00398EC025
MKVAALLFLTLTSSLWTQIAATVVTATVGKTFTIECPQAANQGNNVITLCKATSDHKCDLIASTNGNKYNGYSERVSITHANGLITGTIKHLLERDTGIYWCGRQHGSDIDVLDIILLKVFTDSLLPIKSQINGVMGNVTTVQCLYTEQYTSYKKFFCKVTSVNKCTPIASSDGRVENLYSGRASITTNNKHNFSVTLSNISKGDEGEYWCGAATIVEIEIAHVKILTISEATTRGPTHADNIASNTAQQIWYIILPVMLGLVILSLIVGFIWRKQRPKTTKNEGNNQNPESPITISKFDREVEDMIIYATVTIQPDTQTKRSSTIDANLKEQKGGIKISSSESVEYSTLSFRS